MEQDAIPAIEDQGNEQVPGDEVASPGDELDAGENQGDEQDAGENQGDEQDAGEDQGDEPAFPAKYQKTYHDNDWQQWNWQQE